MEIQYYLRIVSHRKVVVLLTTIVTVALVAFGSYRMTPIYSASSLLRVAQPTSDAVSYSDVTYSPRLIATYVQVLKSRPFLEETSSRLSLGLSANDLAELVQVEAIPNTELIRVSVDNRDPQRAAAIANTLGDLLIAQGQKLYTGAGRDALQILLDQLGAVEAQLAEDRRDLASNATPDSAEASSLAARIRAQEETYSMLLSQYERARVEAALRANSVSFVEPAMAPARPSKPKMPLNLALAAAIGLLGGLGLAFVFENITPTIHSSYELPALTKLRLIGRIPRLPIRRRLRERYGYGPLTLNAESAPASEAFHALGVSILSIHSSADPRTILISSAEPGAGKSTVTAYLGAALAQIGRQVILVDGDQRHPCLHRIFHLPGILGLADAVEDRSVLEKYLRATHFPGLRVLTTGSPDADHAALWHGTGLQEVVKQLLGNADVVIWDTPPILVSAQAMLLAPLADLVLLVVAEDHTTVRQLKLAVDQLGQVGCEAPEIVYNKTRDKDYGYYYRYGPRTRSAMPRDRFVRQSAPYSGQAPELEESAIRNGTAG